MKITIPGLIDPHVHLRDPGQTYKEDFYTGTSAALAGGYTTVIDMPNNTTPITTLERLEEKKALAKQHIVSDIGFHFGSLGDNLDEFEKVKQKVIGLKLYLNETTGNFLIDKEKLNAIFHAWNGGVILVHAEDDAVAAVIEIAKQTGKRAHFCHISLQSDLEQIMKAKEEGVQVTCGVTPHHLFLTDDDGKKLGPFGRMKPFLKSKKDVEFLWKNLASIDVIESDHAPHTLAEKTGRTEARGGRTPSVPPPFGVPGLETTLSLLLNAVNQKRLLIEDVIRLCHDNPSKIFGIKQDQSTTIEIELNIKYILHNTNLHTKCGWTPFDGWNITGKVIRTFIRGTNVMEDNEILVKPGFGRIIP